MSATVSKNIFWLTLSRVAALGFLFLAYTQLFRYLGPFGNGQYQFVLSYVLIFSTVVDFGVQQFITKRMSENPEDTKKYFQNFIAFELVLSLALYILLVAVAFLRNFEPVVMNAVIITGFGMVINAMTYPFLAVMTAKQDLKKVAFINFLNSLVNITVIFLAITFQKYIVFLASIQLIFGIMDIVLYRIFIRKHLPMPEVLQSLKRLDWSLIKNILKSAWPFALLVGFSAIYNRIDVIIITKMLGFEQNGLYTAGYKLFDILSFFPASVSHTLFPFFAALMAKSLVGQVKLNLEKYLRLMVVVALPLAVGTMILSKPIISLMAGEQFLPAAPVLAVLVWASAILFIYIPVNSLVISQLTKMAVIITGANVVINIVGNIILLPILGIKAAAIMTVVSEALQGTFYFYFVRKYITKFKFASILWKPALAALVMGLVLWKIPNINLFLAIGIGVLVYAFGLIVTRFITKEDFQLVKAMFQPDPPIS